jgi:hypothetical protein
VAEKPVMKDVFWQKLADVQPFGIELETHHVRSWFDTVWPLYSERGYTKHSRAISSWWSRVREDDIERAIERYNRIVKRESIKELERRLPPVCPVDDNVIDFFAKVNSNG